MRNFTYQGLPMRVVFGSGALGKLSDEVAELGLSRVLVLCSPGQRDNGAAAVTALGERSVGILAEARMHVPVELARRACDHVSELGADGCVAVGGGSATGLGKAIARELGLPVLAVPTTYSGSEMTPVWGMTEAGRKRTGRDPRVLPRTVLYDPELTLALPPGTSASSGINAIAHAVEALYAPEANPITSLMAEEGVRALVAALPQVVVDGHDLQARAEALYGAWLCGTVLGVTTVSLHHKLCHTLGGTLDLPHAQTHAVVLPHVLAYNGQAAPDAVAALARALGGVPDPALELWELGARLGAPRSLRELGMAEADIPRIVELALVDPYANPRPVTADGITTLLEQAWAGHAPG